MSLEMTEVQPMQAFWIVAKDENGEKQVFIRIWHSFDETCGSWLQGNLTGPHMRKCDQDEINRLEAALIPQVETYVAQRRDESMSILSEIEQIFADMGLKVQ